MKRLQTLTLLITINALLVRRTKFQLFLSYNTSSGNVLRIHTLPDLELI